MIKACIFDLGGTIVDRYSLTPFIAFKGAFENKNINLCSSLIRQGGCLNYYYHGLKYLLILDFVCPRLISLSRLR